jgi:hypothetical protein
VGVIDRSGVAARSGITDPARLDQLCADLELVDQLTVRLADMRFPDPRGGAPYSAADVLGQLLAEARRVIYHWHQWQHHVEGRPDRGQAPGPG